MVVQRLHRRRHVVAVGQILLVVSCQHFCRKMSSLSLSLSPKSFFFFFLKRFVALLFYLVTLVLHLLATLLKGPRCLKNKLTRDERLGKGW
jgi:hypothetical protein